MSEEIIKEISDEYLLESHTWPNKKTAVEIGGVSPENWDKIRGKSEEQIADEAFSEAYERIIQLMKKWVDLPENSYKIIALWIISSYVQQEFSTFPFLFFNAAKGSGKTRVINIVAALSNNAKGRVQTGVNETTLFRTPKGNTLIYDECNSIGSKDKANFRDYLCACYKKGATVARSRKVFKDKSEDYIIDYFEPYRPIVMANIWGMEETLADRCITLILEKSGKPEIVKKIEDFTSNPEIKAILLLLETNKCTKCSVLSKKNIGSQWNNWLDIKYTLPLSTLSPLNTPQISDNLLELYAKIDSLNIDGRNLEIIFPLIIMAYSLSSSLLDEILPVLKEAIFRKKEEQFADDKDITLIEFVSKNCEKYQITYVPLMHLVREFKQFIGDIDNEEQWLNSHWLARALKRNALTLDKRRLGSTGSQVTLNVLKAKEKLDMLKMERKEETR